MKEVLEALKGARLIAKGTDKGSEVFHYLLPDHRVVEVVRARSASEVLSQKTQDSIRPFNRVLSRLMEFRVCERSQAGTGCAW